MVSKHPPLSTATSMIILPGRIFITISSVTTMGALPISFLNAPIATSQVLSCFANILGSITEVQTRWPKLFCSLCNLETLLSNTLTLAPKASALRTANSPVISAPMTTTFVGGTPLIPPNKTPLPELKLLRYCPAINITALPTISFMLLKIG